MCFGVVVYAQVGRHYYRLLNKIRKIAVRREPDDCNFMGWSFLLTHNPELDLKLYAFRAPAPIKLYLSFSRVVLKVRPVTSFTRDLKGRLSTRVT